MLDLKHEVRGLALLDDLEDLPTEIASLASRSLNQTGRDARTKSGRLLRDQLNFPSRYLVGADGKINLKAASPSNLAVRLSASSSPRSLARFVRGTPRKGKVRVEVQPGGLRSMPGAFLLNLRGANSETSNTLLAVRSRSKPRTAYRPRQIGDGLWSLYGPSVSQALLNESGKGIWVDLEPEILAKLEEQFLRQLQLRGL